MNDDVAIRVEHVSKTFKLPHEKQSSVKGLLLNAFKGRRSYEKQEVLKDVSFEIKKGEFFGIVGRNGSGKSTLLKMLAGIYTPSKGSIQVTGKLTPFIELGVGFNPELTGRENVFLNGALLGFNRIEMAAMYDDIVAFAESEKFMDQKLKNYSSGMQVRLAFSIAIRARTDILILDEVLAVGDEAFQQKCIDVFESYKAAKQTVILVTHEMGVVRRFCSKAMLINEGKIVNFGLPDEIAREYSRLNDDLTDDSMNTENSTGQNEGFDIKIFDSRDKQSTGFRTDESLKIKLAWPKNLEIKNAGIGIVKQSGEFIFGANTFDNTLNVQDRNSLDYSMKLRLGPGKYYVMAGFFGKDQEEIVRFIDRGPQFIVREKEGDHNQGLVRLDYTWK